MAKITRQVEMEEEITAGMVTVRENSDGTGLVEFNVVRRIKVDGNPMGEPERVSVLTRTFAEIGNRSFPIQVNGNTVQVTGKMVLDALKSMYSALSTPTPEA